MNLLRYFVRKYSRLLNAPTVLARGGVGMSTAEIGELGEQVAARYIYAHGGKVLYRNYRPPGGGEIDIVVRHGHILAFVEVKARTRDDFGRPAAAVDLKKRRLISRGVNAWLRLLRYPEIAWRCDIAEVDLRADQPPQVNWIQSAFEIEELKRGRPRQWTR
jgi:putative endonuclease